MGPPNVARTASVPFDRDSYYSLDSTGGTDTILPEDIFSFGVLIIVEEHISPTSPIGVELG